MVPLVIRGLPLALYHTHSVSATGIGSANGVP